MKTILIITDNLPDQINGVVTTYKNIEAHAAMDGYNVVVLHPGWFSYISCPFYNEVKIAYPRALDKKIEEINPDHIHIATEGPLGLWARAYLSLDTGRRYNTAYHTKFPEGLKKLLGIPESLTWRYVRWFHKHTGKVLTTTDTMVTELKEHGFTSEVIPWTRGVDRTIFKSNEHDNKGMLTLICVSRVSKEKNLEDFFELDYPTARKIMVGDGPMREEYEKRYPNVEFVGFKTGHDLAEYYQKADVFVFPSKWETFGIVMIEAMACGTPVAAYPVAGPLDVVDEGITGCLDSSLETAVAKCLKLDRKDVTIGSQRWDWQRAWEIFRDNLV
jgi:glycosyltransferase involved in cell wall biosynthesis